MLKRGLCKSLLLLNSGLFPLKKYGNSVLDFGSLNIYSPNAFSSDFRLPKCCERRKIRCLPRCVAKNLCSSSRFAQVAGGGGGSRSKNLFEGTMKHRLAQGYKLRLPDKARELSTSSTHNPTVQDIQGVHLA